MLAQFQIILKEEFALGRVKAPSVKVAEVLSGANILCWVLCIVKEG